MSWKMLYNGNCPPPGPEPFKFIYSASGSDNQLAIDNRGRIYTWGTCSYVYTGQTPLPIAGGEYARNPAIENHGSYMMTYPYQVGNRSDWKKANIYERQFMALDSDGYLWAWSDGTYGMGGWDDTDQYEEYVTNKYRLGGRIALVPTKVNNAQWIDFSMGYTHIVALGADRRAYVWGTNFDGYQFGMAGYASGFKSLTPLKITSVPDVPLKIALASGNNGLVVTESDQIYTWGAYSWGIENTPQPVSLTVPSGVVIREAIPTYSGIVILLTNGDVYCRGELMQFAPGPNYYFDTPTKIPGNHFFIRISAFENVVGALDNQGNIWGWGQAKGFISRDNTYCDKAIYLPGEEPVLVASPSLGARQFTYFSVGNTSHCGIDAQGRLFCWGSDLWGQLGVGYLPEDSSCSPLQVIHPTLDDGTLAADAQSTTGVLFEHILIPSQLLAHDPCGHWHKGGGDTARLEESFAANCWEPTIATDGTHALYVIAGRHRPNELYMLLYHIPTNIWSTALFRKDVLHSNWDGGAAIAGDMYAFHNYAYDIAGEQYQEITSNPRMITYVTGIDGDHVKEWPGTVEMHGRNKVAVSSDGKVACIIRTSINVDIQGSINHGETYVILQAFSGGTVTDCAVVINPIDGLVYVAVTQESANALRVYSGNINGTGWTLKSTTVVDDAQLLGFRVDGTRFFVATGSKLYYSTNNCASFTARELRESSQHFAATGTQFYNLADQSDYYTSNYENTVIEWTPVTQLETLVERCTLHNAGSIAVYSQAKLRNEEGNIVTILLSRNLGQRWNEIQTPLNYYATYEETLNLGDNPVWPFVPQWAKL